MARQDASLVTSTSSATASRPEAVQLRHRRRVLRRVAPGDDDRGARLGQAARHAEPDPAVAAGDDGHTAAEVEQSPGHVRLPLLLRREPLSAV